MFLQELKITQTMKLVLKCGNVIKLYNQALQYGLLLEFIEKEMMVKKETVSMTFLDQEGDQIALACDQDLSIMENLVGEKPYVKVTIFGERKEEKQEVVTKTTKKEESSHKVEEEVKPRHPAVEYIEKLQAEAEEVQKRHPAVQVIQEMVAEEKNKTKIEEEEKKKLAQEEKKLAKEQVKKTKAALAEERQKKKIAQEEERERKKQENRLKKEALEKQRAEKKEEERLKKVSLQEEKKKQAQEEKKKQLAEAKEMKKSEEEEPQKKKPAKNFNVFNRLMAETISTLVDERVRAMIPYVKQQVSGPEEIQDIEGKIVHENFACKICTCQPIIGIRYDCPKCEDFSICERCQVLYDHDHNLIKVKKLDENKVAKKIQPSIKRLYENFFADKSPEKEEPKKESKQAKQVTERFSKYGGAMRKLFGGKKDDYKELIEQHDLKLYGLVGMFSYLKQIPQEVAEKKYSNHLCEKLQEKFKKNKSEFKSFVDENISLEYSEIEKFFTQKFKDEEKAKKEEEKKAQSIGKEQKQEVVKSKVVEETKTEQKKQIEPLKEESKVEPKKETEPKKEESKVEENKQPVPKKEESKVEEKPKEVIKCPGAHLKGQQREIFDLMVEFFGVEKAEEYPSFIQSHYKKGKDNIIQLWSNNISVYQP